MKICFPIDDNQGLGSRVYGHFGSAPLFIVADTETLELQEVVNRDSHHSHGACDPLRALGGRAVDAIVVGGIGAGALTRLNRDGLKVYRAKGATVAENLGMMSHMELPEMRPAQVCDGHHGTCGH